MPAGNTRLVRYFSGKILTSSTLLLGFESKAVTSAREAFGANVIRTSDGQLIHGLINTERNKVQIKMNGVAIWLIFFFSAKV